MNLSLTQAGNYVVIATILSQVLSKYGIIISSDELNQSFVLLATAIGVLISFYGRFRHGDITLLGAKNNDLR